MSRKERKCHVEYVVEIVAGKYADFDNWWWFGSLDGDEKLLGQLRECCADNYLNIKLGTDGSDIWCKGKKRPSAIAYGMFCMLQFQI